MGSGTRAEAVRLTGEFGSRHGPPFVPFDVPDPIGAAMKATLSPGYYISEGVSGTFTGGLDRRAVAGANLTDYLGTVSDARRRALIYFASAARRQFYLDANKPTARLMMAGELLSNAYDLVSVPYSRKLEFTNALDILFDRDDATELLRFLSTCILPE